MTSIRLYIRVFLIWIVMPAQVGIAQQSEAERVFKIDFEKFTLANGLEVIFHVDRSDPVVAVALTAHVGSAREKPGRTGFAHLFEHLLFLESENLGKGGLDRLSARVGGSGANGSTSRDRTNYFQTVPKDALEKMLWAEADKLGWFINTVTEPVLQKEKQVVKNEKRQRVDNQPYGHTFYVIGKNLYPQGHPYSWEVIGTLADVQSATLADVKEFYRRWYVPNNVTLVVSGDFDRAKTKSWIEKYFGEIKRGEQAEPKLKWPGKIEKVVNLYHEDNFARLPALTMTWPTVELYHPDAYALDVLARYLSEGKKAPLYVALVKEQKLTSAVQMFNRSSELAGELYLSVRAFEGTDLDSVSKAIEKALAGFERRGMSESDLTRIKAGQEAAFYNGLASVLGKGFQLAQYNVFAGDPGFVETDIENILAVSSNDVMRVYNKYIKDRKFVVTSFVPKGATSLALDGAIRARVVEEQIQQGAEETFDPSEKATFERTPSAFDRTVEPSYGAAPEMAAPTIWEDRLSNGMMVYGMEVTEVPLVQFSIVLDGGQLLDDIDEAGVANLVAQMMTQGTKTKTPEELEEAIELLGATIRVSAGSERLVLSGNTLSRNYAATVELAEEILLEPRWDVEEFELIKRRTISQIRQQMADPNAIAENVYNELIYGNDDIRSRNVQGSVESVTSISLDDLKGFYYENISPSVSRMHIVGAKDRTSVLRSLQSINERWKARVVDIPTLAAPVPPARSKVYFYDVPDAKQSVLRIGSPALTATSKDFYPATVANYILGGGGFASRLTHELREQKGYTYRISSFFKGSKRAGTFTVGSGVRSNVTLESVQLVKSILRQYVKDFSEEDLQTTKSFLIKSNARAFETIWAKLGMLENISAYGWEHDYVKKREATVRAMTVARIRNLASRYLNSDKMFWLVVGDANTQLERLKDLGFDDPILLNEIPNHP